MERGPGFYYLVCALLGLLQPIVCFFTSLETLPAVLGLTAVTIAGFFWLTPRGRSIGGLLGGLLGLVSYAGGLVAALLIYVGLMFSALSF